MANTYSPTITIIAGIQLILSTMGFIFMLIILWVDMHHDPDWQDPSDTIYSNNVTGVSMTTLSQSQSLTT
ncbi:hypothetical protein Phum_PHUM356070 [Pediculus humanus corporis]|uniref:Uncharacterized protein n=1 Tax=Pediculus humanus subsp. corporis TaxID=121224 RepID=E0VPB1_PEDHC|nr:uncharacterized protein Phum_PHUM356070 [Pediculus humanus corporis]EEB15217.1 hypothetical protein Phum_PHUM356070 [Pediculus humanus corporis]